jgi:hypothetical protein
VHDQQNDYALDESHRLPAHLALVGIRNAEMQRIVEDEPGQIKADFMLCQVAAAFLFVPDEANPG